MHLRVEKSTNHNYYNSSRSNNYRESNLEKKQRTYNKNAPKNINIENFTKGNIDIKVLKKLTI